MVDMVLFINVMPPLFNESPEKYNSQTAQFHIMDTDMAKLQREKAWHKDNGDFDSELMDKLDLMICEVNPFNKFFRNNRDELKRQAQVNPYECQMWLVKTVIKKKEDLPRQRILNDDPVGGEIAAVFIDEQGNPPSGIKIAIYPKGRHPCTICYRNPNCDPMTFPHGEFGYDLNIQHAKLTSKQNKLTLLENYRYKIHSRNNNHNLLFKSGKLFHFYYRHS